MTNTNATIKAFEYLKKVSDENTKKYRKCFKDMTDDELCTEFRHISYKMMYCDNSKYAKLLPVHNAMWYELKNRGLDRDKRIHN